MGVFARDEDEGDCPALYPDALTDPAAVSAYSKNLGGPPPVGPEVAALYRAEPLPEPPKEDLGVVGIDGAQADDLSRTGWAVLFGAKDRALNEQIRAQLAPLLDLRKSQAGTRFHIFDTGDHPYTAGQSVEDWLGTFGDAGISADDLVDPDNGVPFYMMIVAAPDDISFEFQYRLDVYWAVGRLWLRNVADYGAYARSVVANEEATVPTATRELAFFNPRFAYDNGATRIVCDDLVGKLLTRELGDFAVSSITSPAATRDKLLELYGGQVKRPALHFIGSHGALFNNASKSIANCMGAIVTEVWADQPPPPGQETPGPNKTQYVAGRDLPATADLSGTIHILCACYGGGWPKVSSYDGTPVCDDGPGVARLPQTLLAKGALAVLGHIDKAWSYSYLTSGGRDRSGKYQDVLMKLMAGRRAGNATDWFNVNWTVLQSRLAENKIRGLTDDQRHNFRVEIDDARNYVLLGDPAVELRTDLMPVIAPETQPAQTPVPPDPAPAA